MLRQVMETDGRAPCPMCRERISREAKLCPNCRTDLQQHPGWQEASSGGPPIILVVLFLAIVGAIAFFVMNR